MSISHRLKTLAEEVAAPIAMRYRQRVRPSNITVHGVKVTVERSWSPVVQRRLYAGHYEGEEARVLRDTLRPGDRFFEVGAAIGVITSIACGIVGDANVTAVEANPELIPFTKRTTADNGFHPTIINAVLGDTEGPREFYVRDVFVASSLVPAPDARPVSVPGRRFSEALAQAQATFLMIDIEGGEVDLLREPLPSFVRALCMEVHPAQLGAQAIQELLRHLMDQGFVLDTNQLAARMVFLSRMTD